LVNEMDLELFGPFNLRALFLNQKAKDFGVYLWTVRYKEKFLVHYVGETGTSFATRTAEHIKNLLSGHYCIYDPKKLEKGKRDKLWEGWWKSSEFKNPARVVEFLKRYTELSKAACDSIEPICFFLLPFESKYKSDRRIRERVETSIAKATRTDFQDEYLFETSYKRGERRDDETAIKVFIKSSGNILGMPKELEV